MRDRHTHRGTITAARRAFPAPTTATTMRRVIFRETEVAGAFSSSSSPAATSAGSSHARSAADEFDRARAQPGIAQANLSSASAGRCAGCTSSSPRTRRRSSSAARGGALRRASRPAPRLADVLRVDGVALDADEPPAALRPRGLRAGLPDARGRDRGLLPGERLLHARSAERGIRWDDPAFGIEWPIPAEGRSRRRTRPGPTSSRRPRLERRVIIVDRALARAARRRPARARRRWSAPGSWAAGSRCRSSRRRRGWSSSRSPTGTPRARARRYARRPASSAVALSTARAASNGRSRAGAPAVTDDPSLLREADGVDVVARGDRRGGVRRAGRARGDRARQARRRP